ncbi:MAG: thiamine-phosphate kinase, partial [Deltaproteobacteria bacterium]|nr:thiamine-phosphate kinase [Deltaproteobacteria bacterium]
MRLDELGEFAVIERIEKIAAKIFPEKLSSVRLGIGDDAAILRPPPQSDIVTSTDAFVEGTHFRWECESARSIGHRAMVANLSDLAAMGAKPLGFTLALSLPPSLQMKTVADLLRGMLLEARAAGCPLVGGNIARAAHTSLTLSVLGSVKRGKGLRRGAARPGDRIFVTGVLGAAALAWKRVECEGKPMRHRPEARLQAGLALSRLKSIGACIDLSDGLGADLAHVLEASGVGAVLNIEKIPLPRGFRAVCRALAVDPLQLATATGEDYELLFTLRGSSRISAQALTQKLGVRVAEIGTITTKNRSDFPPK